MATLLGTSNITSVITATCNDVSVATNDSSRVTTTGYRTAIGGEAPFYDGGAYNKPQRAEVLYNDELAKYTEDDFIDSDYIDLLDPDTDFVLAVSTAGSPNSPGTADLFLYFDFLDIDPTATVSSIDVQVTLESTIGGYTSYPPYGAQDELHYGKVQARWQPNGFTTGSTSESSQVKITTDGRTTVDLSITRDSAYWGANTGAGNQHCMKVTFTGVVNPPPPAYPGAPSLNVKIYNVRARANYTGRTRRTTDFKTPSSFTSTTVGGFPNPQTISSTGYNFNLPTDALVDGSLIIYGGVGTEPDGSGQTWSPYTTSGNDAHRFTISGSAVTSEDHDRSFGGYFLWGQESTHPSNEGQWSADYGAYDYDGEAGLSRADAVDSNLTLESRYVGNFNSEILKTPYKGAVKLAFVLPIFATADISTNTTLTATPVMTHRVVSTEIETFDSDFAVSTLGGYLLEATSAIATAVTTTLGTAGRIRPGEAAISTSFTTSVQSELELTTTTFSFPTATVADIVDCGITTTTSAQASTEFTQSFTADALGLIRTGFDIDVPMDSTTAVDTDQVFVLALPEANRTFFEPAQTRTYTVPEQLRTETVQAQTRTHTVPRQGHNPAQIRRIDVEQQTRSAPAEGM